MTDTLQHGIRRPDQTAPLAAEPAPLGVPLRSPIPPGSLSDAVVRMLERILWRPAPHAPAELAAIAYAAMTLFSYYADRGEWPEATRVLARAANAPAPAAALRGGRIAATQAFHLAFRGENPTGARDFLPLAGQGPLPPSPADAEAALAAIHFAEGDHAGAAELARSAREQLDRGEATTGADKLTIGWLDEIAARAQAGLAAEPAAHRQESPVARPAARITASWDPGVPSDWRTGWLWRNPHTADLIA